MGENSRGDSRSKKRRFRFLWKKKKKGDTSITQEELAARQQVKFAAGAAGSIHASNQDTAAPAPKASVDERLENIKIRKSWLCQTTFFKNMSKWAFETVDADGSGEVDEKELYSGLLLIHLKLGSYAGPAACKVSNVDISLHAGKQPSPADFIDPLHL